MKKNIIFDLGNVLIEWNIEKILSTVTKNNNEIKGILKKEIFDSGIWEDIDLGKLDILTAEKKVKNYIEPKYHNYINEIFWRWYNYVDINENIQVVIKKLYQKGYNIYILSNTSELYYRLLDEKFSSIKEYISAAMLSYEEKLKKPDNEIYKRFLMKFNLQAEECIFFDDLDINVQAAKNNRISAYVYRKSIDIEKIIENENSMKETNASVAIQVLPKVKDDVELLKVIDEIIMYIRSKNLKTHVGPFETTIEGNYEELMEIVKQCQILAIKAGAQGVMSYVKISYKPNGDLLTIDKKINKYLTK